MNAVSTEAYKSRKSRENQSLYVDKAKLIALVRALRGADAGRPSDDDPRPVGPFGPVIREAVRRSAIFGPQPEPWLGAILRVVANHYPALWEIIGGGPGGPGGPAAQAGEEVGLNPQPLPPRAAFLFSLAQVAAERAELIQTTATLIQQEQGGSFEHIATRYLSDSIDELCPPQRIRWPFPWPPPPWWSEEMNAADLLLLASAFDEAARATVNEPLRGGLQGAAARLEEAGMAQLQA